MRVSQPLLITGTARSGSTLLYQMLNAHPAIHLVSDPVFPLFRSLRNQALRQAALSNPWMSDCVDLPLQDYYFSHKGLQVMDMIQDIQLDMAYDQRDWPELSAALAARAQYEAPALLPLLKELAASSYHGIFDNLFQAISSLSGACCLWVGFKEVWIIEFFAALARAYPSARMIILLRDPRATVGSMMKMKEKDPLQQAHTLSYARHWRKYVALAWHYASQPLFEGRLLTIKYEDLVGQPLEQAKIICGFLDITYHASMLDPNAYVASTGETWQGNSSFVKSIRGVSDGLIDRWRQSLDPVVVKLIDLVCGPEMELVGYHPDNGPESTIPDSAILDYLLESNRNPGSWRSDLGDPQQDYGFELFRQSLIRLKAPSVDRSLIRRSYLFEEVFETLRQHAQLDHIAIVSEEPRGSGSTCG